MTESDVPLNESQRIKELHSYSILDTLPESDYDNITKLASQICETKISLVSLVDRDRQWFKSRQGLEVTETPRSVSFCSHAINKVDELMIVEDSRKDQRFLDNPLVTGEPHVIFYAGIPIKGENDLALGTLCVIDDKPKRLSDNQINALKTLSSQVQNVLRLRKSYLKQKELNIQLAESKEKLSGQERNLRLITDTISDVFYLYNFSEKRFEIISSNCEKILGVDAEFFYSDGNYVQRFVHPEDQKSLKKALKFNEIGGKLYFEFRIVKNQKTKWVFSKLYVVKQGGAIFKCGVFRDITEFKKAEKTIIDQNLNIKSSVNYARGLQKSVLPTIDQFKKVWPNSFVLAKPRDIISGDFFMANFVERENYGVLPTLIVGDCTGHGVPGGVLTFICAAYLKEICSNKKISSLSAVLEDVSSRIVNLFNSNKEKYIQDGMDAAICSLDIGGGKLFFSGANSDCVVIRKKQLTRYRGTSRHVGFNITSVEFNEIQIDVEKNDLVIFTTDGFIDQFGGPDNRKFLRRKLYDLLVSNNDLPLSELRQKLNDVIENWQGMNPQTDDICVVGFRV